MDGLPSDWIGKIFSDSLIEVMSKTTSFSLTARPEPRDGKMYDNVGAMTLNSRKSGAVFISADEADMRVVCSYMTGAAKDEVTPEDELDALCEIVNMTAGNAKVRIDDPEYKYSLTPPFVISGKSLSITTKKRSQVVSMILSCEEISFKLMILFY